MAAKNSKVEIQSRIPLVVDWINDVVIETNKEASPNFLNIVVASPSAEPLTELSFDAKSLKRELQTKIAKICQNHGWKGQNGSIRINLDHSPYLCLAPLGLKVSKTQVGRHYGLEISKAIKGLSLKGLSIHVPNSCEASDIFEGLAAGLYQPNVFLGQIPKRKSGLENLPSKVEFLGGIWEKNKQLATRALARATAICRFTQDAPPNWLDPQMFADVATLLGEEAGLKVSVLGKKEIEKLGMGSFLSVALGSPKEPKLIKLEIKGRSSKQKLALVGKGLTFDTGGTSLKPPAGMGEMKYDMSGGAAVLGAALFLAEIQPAMDVVCLIGAVENIGGGSATRPSDVVVASNQKSIDIQNTDAEGRLVLADLLHYAIDTCKASAIVDLATLTGAVLMALGHAGAGLMTNSQTLGDQVLAAAKASGEPMWQLPLWPELFAEVKSDVADLCNIAKPSVKAGTIIGGIFLSEFVGETPWVHLDIAGTAWQCSATGYPGPGGSGYGVKLLGQLASQMLTL